MSEVQTRPSVPRGRGSGRGGRGGYSTRGGRPRQTPSNKMEPAPATSYEDEGEIGELKKQYSPKLNTLREMFPDWTDEDLVFALQETDGDLEATIERISEGNVSQWGEVKKKTKDRVRGKAKDSAGDGHEGTSNPRVARGRGAESSRGRARGAERGRGAGRGRGGAAVNGSKKSAPDPPAEPSANSEDNAAWGAAADAAEKRGSVSPDAGSWEVVTPSEAAPPPVAPSAAPAAAATPAADPASKTSKPDGTRTWASMLKPAPKPKSAPVKPKVAAPPTIKPSQPPPAAIPAAGDPEIGKPPKEKPPVETPQIQPSIKPADPVVDLTPSKDELTETNLEQIQDVSPPAATDTAASNAGTTDARSAVDSLTPSQAAQPTNTVRLGMGGFATTAHKATSGSSRAPSFQRRVKDQQEAVVMPGHHAVDRATVQFGSLGLGSQEDIDGDREEAETRTQPPQHSPVAPRASLPPAAQQTATDAIIATTTRPAPGLPPVSSHVQADSATASQPTGANYGYNQFNSLYGSGISQAETSASQTKPFETFAQQGQPGAGHTFENFPPHSQAAGQLTSQPGAFSSSGSEYPSYYSSDNQRNAYQNYYSGYGQQAQPGSENAASQQKPGVGQATSNGESQPAAHTQQAGQNRFPGTGEGQPSGHSTPNPLPGQQTAPGTQSGQLGQTHGQAGAHGGYPYAGPYYNHPYYSSSYMNQMGHHQYGPERPPFDDARRYEEFFGHSNQYGYAGRPGGYGSAPYGGAGKYGQPHSGYGMSSQSPFDAHSASPANAGSYGQPHSVPGRESSSGLGTYGRTGSTQPTEGQTHNSSAFSGMSDVFNRSQSNFSAQTSQQATQQGGTEDSSRGFNDTSKIAGGPSPAPGQSGARPGSAANLAGQSNLPTTQAQTYSGYPSQMGQMHGQQSQYSTGLGGLGGHTGHHQAGGHQSNVYGGYGGFGANYYSNSSRGGWSGNYGH